MIGLVVGDFEGNSRLVGTIYHLKKLCTNKHQSLFMYSSIQISLSTLSPFLYLNSNTALAQEIARTL